MDPVGVTFSIFFALLGVGSLILRFFKKDEEKRFLLGCGGVLSIILSILILVAVILEKGGV
jgi:uncharacterized membrane protein HdeD (DUF308 family)